MQENARRVLNRQADISIIGIKRNVTEIKNKEISMKTISEFYLGDMLLRYAEDDAGRVGMTLIPAKMKEQAKEKKCAQEIIAQAYLRGDFLPNAYGNGATMALSGTSAGMRFFSQEKTDNEIVTTLGDARGITIRHFVSHRQGERAVRVYTELENGSDAPITAEMLSSVSLGGLTPFDEGDAAGKMYLYRARSAWSAEGRLCRESIEDLGLEQSWACHGIRIEKFGQTGSMPVRGFFPFAALEDSAAGVIWAMQLAIPSSWQIEARRKDNGLSLTGGLADYDYGHWAKTLQQGESFRSPQAYLTVGVGDIDAVTARLADIMNDDFVGRGKPLPVIFNEYCTTWGNPSEQNLEKIIATLKGHDVDTLVIDAGWYGDRETGWSNCGGDWIPDEKTAFPKGLKYTADMIKAAGMKPGLWFEPETVARSAKIGEKTELLLKRNGTVIDTDNRRFLDMRMDETHEYLRERVTGLLRKCGFEYIKADYNDCIGIGCDGEESLGEGLRKNIEGTRRFFKEMREEIPGLMIENCASGGHRLEPSMMAVSDMASFSDAHECREIPIIAANLHRLILPAQSQIWAVLRAKDDDKRLNYSLVNTLLGVMCLSGDIYDLNKRQWALVDSAVTFYRETEHIIRGGESRIYGKVSASWRHPEGWQAVARTEGNETLTVIHTFGSRAAIPDRITIPVKGSRIVRTLSTEGNEITLANGELSISLNAEFEAIAVYTA